MALPLDIEAVRKRADEVLAEPLYWFPVRHHSPAVARHLRSAIRARKPKLVLIEGPAHANSLIRFLTDPKTKPPVALYCSYRDDENTLGLAGIESPAPDIPARFASWYPLLPYSPELVAMKEAKEVGAEVLFVDLPYPALIKPAAKGAEGAPASAGPDPKNDEVSKEEEKTFERRTWEALALESGFYKKLAEVAGYRSWNECWDTLFEGTRHDNHEAFRKDMAYFCGSVRATSPVDRLTEDGTLPRERHMWRAITAALNERKVKPADAMVVCGGFHIFMDREDGTPPPEPPKGTVYVTVAPYSFFRTSELTGYGAGNRAPQWYSRMAEAWENGSGVVEAMVEHVVAVLARGRTEGEHGLSSADAISVTQHARMLAALRGRQSPVLDDIRDALVSCCCKGRPEEEGSHLVAAMTATEIGTAVGRVTPELGRLPLVHDFYAQIDVLDLGEVMGKEKRLKLTLDLRDPLAQKRSVLLHRLVELGVPLGEQTGSGPDGVTLFREEWTLAWSSKVEAELIEKNLFGDSIEDAATSVLDGELARQGLQAGPTCGLLVKSVCMDLPGLVLRIQDICSKAIDNDKGFVSLAEAFVHVQVLDRHAAHKGLRRDVLAELMTRCFGRACFALSDAASVPEDQQQEVMRGLMAMAEAVLADGGNALDMNLFSESVNAAAEGSTVPYLRGAFFGTLTEIRAMTADDLAGKVSAFARERPEVMVTAGQFLDGVISVSKTSIMLGADALIGAIDQLLRAADWQNFCTMLPWMRGAFERLHERQRMALADRVAVRYGLAESEVEEIATLHTNAAAATAMAAIDARVADIMGEWG
jgi:hypothetical protein